MAVVREPAGQRGCAPALIARSRTGRASSSRLEKQIPGTSVAIRSPDQQAMRWITRIVNAFRFYSWLRKFRRGHPVEPLLPRRTTQQARPSRASYRTPSWRAKQKVGVKTAGRFVPRGPLSQAHLSAPVDEVGGHDDGRGDEGGDDNGCEREPSSGDATRMARRHDDRRRPRRTLNRVVAPPPALPVQRQKLIRLDHATPCTPRHLGVTREER